MKKISLALSIILPVILALILVKFFFQNQKKADPVVELPNDWFFMQRSYPVGKINYPVYLAALKSVQQQKKTKNVVKDSTIWEFAGPLNICGRLSDVEMHSSDILTVYAGAASGGIFKSNNAGESWIPVFDDALSLSIGDIAIAPTDAQVIYAGTGEANAGGGSQTYDGVGIYKSTDAGQTWQYCGLEESRNIGRMAVHPTDPDIVYVAAMGDLFGDNPDRGIYKTTDGGLSWEQILYISDSTGGIDVVIHPANPDSVYAAMWERVRRPNRRSYGGLTCGIYRTFDGGNSWNELTSGLPSPGTNIGRIGIDICQSEPSNLYAIYADKTGYFEGVYKTINGGNTWIQTNDGSLADCYSSYGWWFGRISVDPTDPDIAYVIGFDLHKTSNGGNSWSNISSWTVHVDQHGLYIHPQNHNFLVLGNDGGFYSSQNGGNSWTWLDNLPVTQFYTSEIDRQHPERLYGGTQDNGTNRTLTGNTDDWQQIFGGDGFYVLVDPVNNNYVYAEYQYGNFAKSTNGGVTFNTAMTGISSGDRKNWNTPVAFDPANPEILYYGANRLYKSTNRATSWSAISDDLTNGPGINLTYGTISTIGVSPVNPDIVYVGTDDGNVWVSAETGSGWEYLSLTLPDRWVTRVVADPLEENTAYVTFSGYRWDEYLPHIFRTTDRGQNWEEISGNLPELPINDVIIDPVDNTKLYVASDAGVFVTEDLGQNWEVMGSNLPMVPVNDLTLHNETRKLVAATYGRSMYSYDLYQDTLATSIYSPAAGSLLTKINIYPNPFRNFLIAEVGCSQPVRANIEICSIRGERASLLFTGDMKPGKNRFNWTREQLGMLKDGTYFLKVTTGRQSCTRKIIFRGN
jgi:photosystem II stability/assembly factor-like uncharacterized protein